VLHRSVEINNLFVHAPRVAASLSGNKLMQH
jgi:hypothetical protein